MQRKSFVMRLKPGGKAEYIRRHDTIWPEMAGMLREAGVTNYSIWWYRDLLFGYWEAEDVTAAEARKRESQVAARWSAFMADLIAHEEIDGQRALDPELVFYQP